jgi:hypothetical protein
MLCDGGIAKALDRVTGLMQAHGDRSERRPITGHSWIPKHEYPLDGRHRTSLKDVFSASHNTTHTAMQYLLQAAELLII